MNLDKSKTLKMYVDADLSGNWHKSTAKHNASTSKSCTVYVVIYTGCPII